MTTVYHISDLHFGRERQPLVRALIEEINDSTPELVAVSGDLTQSARRREFAATRDFLAQLTPPVLVVPGNHDVPDWDVIRRLLRPWRRYGRYITEDMYPSYSSPTLAVLGLNSARRWSPHTDWSRGRLSPRQMDEVERFFSGAEPDAARVVVVHHPFIAHELVIGRGVIGRKEMALQCFGQSQVDLMLSGHLHIHHSETMAAEAGGRTLVAAQAATTLSDRLVAGYANSFNAIEIDRERIRIDIRCWLDDGGFRDCERLQYRRSAAGWEPDPARAHR
jgi:3',5'-cyclic AMP phosphodiesterase CpdA